MKLPLDRFAGVRLRSGTGLFEYEGQVHRVDVARTPVGLRRVEGDGAILQELVFARAHRALGSVLARAPRLGFLKSVAQAASSHAALGPGKRPTSIGVRPSAVTLHSEAVDESAAAQAAAAVAERDDRSGKAGERRPAKVIEDSLVVDLGKKKRVRLTARARMEEIQSLAATMGIDPAGGHRFEPAPWAVWRASAIYAPFKKGQSVHLRFVLGETTGIALLASTKRPLAWHAISWEQGSREEAIVQAFHLLRIHAVRRLRLDELTQVTLQGEPFAAACESALAGQLGVTVETVPGPAYDGDFVAYGLALGALETNDSSLNLARSLQPARSIMELVPWGEAALLVSLFLCMFLVLHGHRSGLRKQLANATQQAADAKWAHGQHPTKLKQDLAALKREVEPLKHFLTRELSFAQATGAISESIPSNVWLVSLTAEDLFWEKNSNKALGERYILLTAGAPSEREGSAPPEINETVHALDTDPLFGKVLPRLKLSEVNWRKQGGVGYSVFSLLATPKEAASKK